MASSSANTSGTATSGGGTGSSRASSGGVATSGATNSSGSHASSGGGHSSSSSGFCGNAQPDPGEECDDGNLIDEDPCLRTCKHNTCGDGYLNVIEEFCDDGNTGDGDGCEHDCIPTPVCGNRILERGEACDDGNQLNGDGCEQNCTITPGCQAGLPPAQGCPCEVGTAAVECFDDTQHPERANNPPCHKGTRSCLTTGHWGTCVGQVIPTWETCDGVDNNCDGNTDEGVLSACGDCVPECGHVVVGDDEDFPMPGDPLPEGVEEVGTDGVGIKPDGTMTLDSNTVTMNFLWIANTNEGTVSKIDTTTGAETARYYSFNRNVITCHLTTRGTDTCSPTGGWKAPGGVYLPSRTAVDYFGNVWVGNRQGHSSATKIMAAEVDCTDRNHNGIIDTSFDKNKDHIIDMAATGANREFWGEEDECISMSVVVGQDSGHDYYARALAIDAGDSPGDPGDVWVGMYAGQTFYELDGKDGSVKRTVSMKGTGSTTPYGAAIDSNGILWAVNLCCGSGGIRRIDTTTGNLLGINITPPGSISSYGQYGIAVDHNGRVWLGGYNHGYQPQAAFRYDPVANSWLRIGITLPAPWPSTGWQGRGVGVDRLGNVWMAMHNGNNSAMVRMNADTGVVSLVVPYNPSRPQTGITPPSGTNTPVGIGVDFDGNVWAIDQNGANGRGNAARLYIDPTTNEPGTHPTTGNKVDFFPVGAQPYTYSDFTGLGLRTITRAAGDYSLTIRACPDGSPAYWDRIVFDADTPAGTGIEVWVRVGNDKTTLRSQPEYGPWVVSPAELQQQPNGPVPNAKYILITFRLKSADRQTTPILKSFDARWYCVPP